MCMKTDCSTCGKPTWKGCGKHIEQALKDVPEDERCKCPRDTCETTASAIKKTEETKTVNEVKAEETKNDTEIKTEETKAETTTTDNELKTEKTKEKSD